MCIFMVAQTHGSILPFLHRSSSMIKQVLYVEKSSLSLKLIATASKILKRLALPIVDGNDSLAGLTNPSGSGLNIKRRASVIPSYLEKRSSCHSRVPM